MSFSRTTPSDEPEFEYTGIICVCDPDLEKNRLRNLCRLKNILIISKTTKALTNMPTIIPTRDEFFGELFIVVVLSGSITSVPSLVVKVVL